MGEQRCTELVEVLYKINGDFGDFSSLTPMAILIVFFLMLFSVVCLYESVDKL
jgi:hypothetical protein